MPKILHIEDDPANRLLVRKLLAPAGFLSLLLIAFTLLGDALRARLMVRAA